AADVAVEMNVVQRELRRLDLERIFFAEIAQILQVRVPVQRVVVEVHLRVERQQIAGLRDDERIDLDERRVGGDERFVQRRREPDELVHLRAVEIDGEPELPRLERDEADARLDVHTDDFLRRL